MSKDVYDLSEFTRNVPKGNKPYYKVDPQSEEEERRLFDYLGEHAHFKGLIAGIHAFAARVEGDGMHIARALPIGETAKGEIVYLIVRGFVYYEQFEGDLLTPIRTFTSLASGAKSRNVTVRSGRTWVQ